MALANLVLADGASTPVDHTFTYNSEIPVADWSDKVGGISIGENHVTISISRPTQSRKSQKVSFKVWTPILETISGDAGGYTPAPKVAYTCLFEGHFVCPDRCTLQNRKDIFAFAKNLFANAMFKATVVDQLPAA
jgi:hypothetical protein